MRSQNYCRFVWLIMVFVGTLSSLLSCCKLPRYATRSAFQYVELRSSLMFSAHHRILGIRAKHDLKLLIPSYSLPCHSYRYAQANRHFVFLRLSSHKHSIFLLDNGKSPRASL